VKPPISQLSKQEKKKMRQQWRQDQKKHRDRKRATEEILNFTPESIESPAELEPNSPNVSVDTPKASSTQQREACNYVKYFLWVRVRFKTKTMLLFEMKMHFFSIFHVTTNVRWYNQFKPVNYRLK